uniref:Uncharacterized protein n=1 Tax=Physcomitrium patens TaxID=3218 RepID=A0A2K1IRQ4_PHYPA|nr:hypothetical protein PHYPA_026081 [Physcomitrium patens]
MMDLVSTSPHAPSGFFLGLWFYVCSMFFYLSKTNYSFFVINCLVRPNLSQRNFFVLVHIESRWGGFLFNPFFSSFCSQISILSSS